MREEGAGLAAVGEGGGVLPVWGEAVQEEGVRLSLCLSVLGGATAPLRAGGCGGGLDPGSATTCRGSGQLRGAGGSRGVPRPRPPALPVRALQLPAGVNHRELVLAAGWGCHHGGLWGHRAAPRVSPRPPCHPKGAGAERRGGCVGR